MDISQTSHRDGGASHPPTLLLVGLLVQLAASGAPDPIPSLPIALRVAGGGCLLLGLALNILATRGFDRAATPIRPLSPPQAMVTEGVYRISRNPMYLGLVLILVGAALALSNLWAALVVPPFGFVMGRLIRQEEALMEDVFGEAYRTYRRRVRRWI